MKNWVISLFYLTVFVCFISGTLLSAQEDFIPRPEYPRPQFQRAQWKNLNVNTDEEGTT